MSGLESRFTQTRQVLFRKEAGATHLIQAEDDTIDVAIPPFVFPVNFPALASSQKV